MGIFILLFITNPSFAEEAPPRTEETSGTVEATDDPLPKEETQNSEPEEEGENDTAAEKDTAEGSSSDTATEKDTAEESSNDTASENGGEGATGGTPQPEEESTFSWGTLLIGLFIGAIVGFLIGNRNSSSPAQKTPPKQTQKPSPKRKQAKPRQENQKPKTKPPQPKQKVQNSESKPVQKPRQEPQKKKQSNNAIKISSSAPTKSPSEQKPTPSKGIRIGSTKPTPQKPTVARIPAGLRIEEYLRHLLQHFPKIERELSDHDRKEFAHLQQSLHTIIQSWGTHQKDDVQKIIKRELIPALDDTALLISKLSENVYLENKDSDYLEWLIELLFSHISQECTRLQLFSIHDITPFKTDFDPNIHHAISASRCGYDFENKIVSISKLQLTNPSTDEIIRSAEVIVGK